MRSILLLSLVVTLALAGRAEAGEFRYLPERAKHATVTDRVVVLHGPGWLANRRALSVAVFIDGVEHADWDLPGWRWCRFQTWGRGGSVVDVNYCGRVARFTAWAVEGRHRVTVRWLFRS